MARSIGPSGKNKNNKEQLMPERKSKLQKAIDEFGRKVLPASIGTGDEKGIMDAYLQATLEAKNTESIAEELLLKAMLAALAALNHAEKYGYFVSPSAAAEVWSFVNGYGGSLDFNELTKTIIDNKSPTLDQLETNQPCSFCGEFCVGDDDCLRRVSQTLKALKE